MLTPKKSNQIPGHAGAARAASLLFILVIGLLWAGGQKLYTALTNREPTVMSYEQYAKTRPTAAWLTITNCQINLARACYLSYPGDQNPLKYYIPVQARISGTDTLCILLKTGDPRLMATIRELKTLKSPAAVEGWVLKNRERIFPRQDVSGLVCFGIDMKSGDRAELARVQKGLAEDFVILDADAQPSVAAGISYTAAGLALLAALIIHSRRK